MRSLVTLILLCSVSVTFAGSIAFVDPSTGVKFPQELAKLEFSGVHDFEQPGLGRALTYSGLSIEATIYIYNLGREKVPTDVESQEIRSEFDDAKDDVVQVDSERKATHLGDTLLSVKSKPDPIAMRSAKFELQAGGENRYSYVYLFSDQNQFVKVRLTCSLGEKKCDARSLSFVKDLATSFERDRREPIPRDTYHRMVEDLIADPYGEHADALRAVLYAYADKIRPEFVLCLDQVSPLVNTGNDEHTYLVFQVAISSADYLLDDPAAIDDEYRYQLAGLKGATREYESMLATKPGVRIAFMDELVELRDAGRLGEHVRAHPCDD